jgi:hypothetical protein
MIHSMHALLILLVCVSKCTHLCTVICFFKFKCILQSLKLLTLIQTINFVLLPTLVHEFVTNPFTKLIDIFKSVICVGWQLVYQVKVCLAID